VIENEGKCKVVVGEIRKRKGLKGEDVVENYLDKL
jgi:hypothetical protein